MTTMFDWQNVLVLWIAVGIPACVLASVAAWLNEHPVLAVVLGLAVMMLLSLAVGLPEEVIGL